MRRLIPRPKPRSDIRLLLVCFTRFQVNLMFTSRKERPPRNTFHKKMLGSVELLKRRKKQMETQELNNENNMNKVEAINYLVKKEGNKSRRCSLQDFLVLELSEAHIKLNRKVNHTPEHSGYGLFIADVADTSQEAGRNLWASSESLDGMAEGRLSQELRAYQLFRCNTTLDFQKLVAQPFWNFRAYDPSCRDLHEAVHSAATIAIFGQRWKGRERTSIVRNVRFGRPITD